MAKKPDFEMPEDIPSWLMTFSDVITLLMTFFILLLTFATNQPETFERVQVAMFSGGGAAGIAGPPQGPLELDSIITRIRPRSGRLTKRGAEIPPVHVDPTMKSVNAGLKGLENEEDRELSTLHATSLPISSLIEADKPSSQAATLLRMLAAQMRNKPFTAQLLVRRKDDLAAAHLLAWSLHTEHGVDSSKIGVGCSHHAPDSPPCITFVLNRPLDGERFGR